DLGNNAIHYLKTMVDLGVTLWARLFACIFHLWPKSGITLMSHCVPPQNVPLYSPYLKGYRCNPERQRLVILPRCRSSYLLTPFTDIH
ncbi:hypothetical protein, partial [Vibrio sp. 10N.222.52.C12]|uniref:hypothetical protein n=1 Tax=Vibrio sp. 10N.222.52.C12 TaxID=3229630 RepID=UPI0035520B69